MAAAFSRYKSEEGGGSLASPCGGISGNVPVYEREFRLHL